MHKRTFILASLASPLLTAPTLALAYEPITAGKDYRIVSSGEPQTDRGVSVYEFFDYLCPHCHAIDTPLSNWAATRGQSVSLTQYPVALLDTRGLYQATHCVLEALNLLAKHRSALFEAAQAPKKRFAREADAKAWLINQGLDPKTVGQTWESQPVRTKAARIHDLSRRYSIENVPALVVNGRYYTDGAMLGSPQRAFQVLDHLIEISKR